MLDVTLQTVRLFLHILAATVWVGGQLSLAALVPSLRDISPSAPRVAGEQFARFAWPAYWVLVATGIWNVLAVQATWRGAYGVTLIVKIAVVALSGISAWLHGRSRSRAALTGWGAVSALSAVAALFLGILLHG